MERAIREAQERGEFDNLPGAGKPLRGIGTSDVDDPDWWVKGLVQREQLDLTGAMPTALALRKERQTYPESLLDLRTEESVRAVLEDFNRRVKLDRLRPAVGPMPPLLAPTVDVDDLVGQWRRLRDERVEQERAERAQRAAAAQAEHAAAATQARLRDRVRSWVRGALGRG